MSVPRSAQRNFCIADTEKKGLVLSSPPRQKQTIIFQLCSQIAFTLLYIPHMFCPPKAAPWLKMVPKYVFNMGSFSLCLMLLPQVLESTAWRTCETPTVVAELMEAKGKGREGARGSCCSPKANVKMNNANKKQQEQD